MKNLVADNIGGHNPLPSHVYLAKSKLHGMGVFTEKPIHANHDFGITHVADDRFSNGFIRTPFGGFINHSNKPNCRIYELGDTLHIQTVAEIKAYEELTIDYRPWYKNEEVAKYKDF